MRARLASEHLVACVVRPGARLVLLTCAGLPANRRILTGLYGVLRPLDVIKPYRLEMGAKMATARGKDLYAYWGSRVADTLREDVAELPPGERAVVNVASAEYFQIVKPYVETLGVPVYTMVFHGATVHVKAARGAIVRYAALEGATRVEQLRGFTGLAGEWQLNEKASDEHNYVFERGAPTKAPAAGKAPPQAKAAKRPAPAAAEGAAAAPEPAKRGARR